MVEAGKQLPLSQGGSSRESSRVLSRPSHGRIPELSLRLPQLMRWDIRLDRFACRSVVSNHDYGFWEKYRWWIFGGAFVIIVRPC